MIVKIQQVVGFAGVVVAVVVIAWTRFANPDLTETQLFLQFWQLYGFCLLVMGAGCLMVAQGEKRR